jgi:hypothetical protein
MYDYEESLVGILFGRKPDPPDEFDSFLMNFKIDISLKHPSISRLPKCLVNIYTVDRCLQLTYRTYQYINGYDYNTVKDLIKENKAFFSQRIYSHDLNLR